MTLPIKGFFGLYRFLSNFWPITVYLDSVEYPSVEHAYQAAKSYDPAYRESVRKASSPGAAKRAGRSRVKLRSDWDSIKESIMLDLVRQKFTSNEELRRKLLATKDALLEETNTWGDTFWGVCQGTGDNRLGKILMQIRDELRRA